MSIPLERAAQPALRIYLSFARDDADRLRQFVQDLDRRLPVDWIEPLRLTMNPGILSLCECFVAFCTVRYFLSEQCGREWALFQSRLAEHGNPPLLIPVLWEAFPLEGLPAAARNVELFTARDGMPLGGLEQGGSEYSDCLDRLAKLILSRTSEHPLSPHQPALRLEDFPDIFEPEIGTPTIEHDPAPSLKATPRANLQMLADAALESDDEDLLGFGVYADAIAGLIDHPKTKTPLTLAINGPWGAGKSTLGRMIERRLTSKPAAEATQPHVTCWFNAWMHDDAADLAAAFAGQVAAAADRARPFWRQWLNPIPRDLVSPETRVRRRLLRVLLVVLGLGLPLLWVVLRLPGIGTAVKDSDLPAFVPLLLKSVDANGKLGLPISAIALTVLVLRSVWTSATTLAQFVGDPASTATAGSMERVRSQLAKLIRQGTPRGSRFVVFIDDLERCRPPRAVDVLEVVNQLLTHPGVVTVVMADMPAVAACVEVKYEKLAELYQPASGTNEKASRPGNYGRLYLQKIVQLQFDLPSLRQGRIAEVLEALNRSRGSFTGPRPFLLRGLVEGAWRPDFTVDNVREQADASPPPQKPLRLAAWAFFLPLLWISSRVAHATYRGVTLTRSRMPPLLRSLYLTLRAAPVLVYAFAVLHLLYDALRLEFTRLPQGVLSIPWLLFLLFVSSIWTAIAAWLEAVGQRDQDERSALRARVGLAQTEWSGAETNEEQWRQIAVAAGFQEGADLFVREQRYLAITDQSEVFEQAQSEAIRHLPPLPRNAKRLLNSLRLHLYVAHERGLLDGVLTPAHVGKWVVLRERWPDLAQALIVDPARINAIEDESKRHENLAALASALENDAELATFCSASPLFGDVLAQLVHLEKKPET